MKLSNVDTVSRYKLICHFKLAADIVGGGIWKFVNDMACIPGKGGDGIRC